MLRRRLIILNKLGLHARASMKLINIAGRFQSSILIRYQEYEADAKDILEMMSLGASQGAEIELIINGEDENSALEQISELINNRFGEIE